VDVKFVKFFRSIKFVSFARFNASFTLPARSHQ
jgi:hypothetical protein